MRLNNKRLTEKSITDYLTSQYGGDQDPEIEHKKRFGLRYQLQVRKGEGEETHWVQTTLWFASQFKRAAVRQRITNGAGTLGQQFLRNRLRNLEFVDIAPGAIKEE